MAYAGHGLGRLVSKEGGASDGAHDADRMVRHSRGEFKRYSGLPFADAIPATRIANSHANCLTKKTINRG
jgi:hypothetical protein